MRKKILVVDDDLAILEVIRIILDENNYKVLAISDASQVEESITQLKPDLILLDIWMSGFDGRDIIKALRAKEETSKIPILIISANNDTEKIAKESGADGFLAKPFDINDLLSITRKYTDQ